VGTERLIIATERLRAFIGESVYKPQPDKASGDFICGKSTPEESNPIEITLSN